MFRKQSSQAKSKFPVSASGNAGDESFDEFLLRLETLLEGDDAEAFFEAVGKGPARWQRKPEVMLIKSLGFLLAGDREEGRRIIDEIEKVHPRYVPLYFYKAGMYMEDESPAHVVRMVAKSRSLGRMDDEAEAELQEMENISRQMLKDSAAELGVSYEVMEKASWHHEASREKMAAGHWGSAEQLTREAIRLIPHWTSPHNNHSYLLYFLGRIAEAFDEARTVLTLQEGNLHALKNLVIFNVGLGKYQEARDYSIQMAKHLNTLPLDAAEMDTIISVFGLVRDDERLWALAQQYLKRDVEDLLDISWTTLGIAAVRTGHLKAAKTLLEKSEPYYQPAQSLAVEVRKALRTHQQVSTVLTYPALGLVLPVEIIEELTGILGKHLKDERPPRHIQKKLEEYIQNRPFVVNGLFQLLDAPEGSEAVSYLLLLFNRTEIDERLLAFALGQTGTSRQRLSILSALLSAGRQVPPNPIRFWNEERGEWTDVDLNRQWVVDDLDFKISPKAAEWARKAEQVRDDGEKIKYWRKAVEVDPKSGYAVHMLGVLLLNNGQEEEGRKLAYHAIEVDPDYMFAYANLALIEMQKEQPNFDLAMEFIKRVSKAPVITTQTAFLVHVANMRAAIHRKDFQSARMEYETAADIFPDDPMLEGWDARLSLGEVFAGDWLAKWQEESRQRAHRKAMRTKLEMDSGIYQTLPSLTRDALGAVADRWGVTAYGKKAELVDRIAERMLDGRSIEHVWKNLNEVEKTASRWVMENHGVRAWKEFTEAYGGDEDESADWKSHAPQSVIGRLRQVGILAIGTLDNQEVVFMPVEIRSSLRTLI